MTTWEGGFVNHLKLPPHPWFGIRPWGRHSLVLLIAGLVYMGMGLSAMTSDVSLARAKALKFALIWMPMPYWGFVFMVAGALCVLSSRWPPVSKNWGLNVLTGLSAGWSAFYVVGWIFNHGGNVALAGATSWGLIAFLWWAISGLVDPKEVAQ